MPVTRKRGDTYPEQFQIIDTELTTGINISGCSVILTVDPAQSPTTADNNLFAINGTVTDARTGKCEFVLSPIQADQQPGTYWYDIQLIDVANRTRTVVLDKWIVVQDIGK